MDQENPSFYAIIPASVRYSDIIPHAKLLYGEITALSNKTGSCYASNTYFSALYGVSTRQVSKWIGELEKNGFIVCKIEQEKGNTRYISIVDTYRTKVPDPIEQKFHTYRTKVPDPIEQKFLHNNTMNNTMNNTDIIIIDREEKKERILSIEGVRKVINEGKLQEDFFYKIGDETSLIETIADFLDHPSTQKRILNSENTERNLRKWLKPKYETEEDRNVLIQSYRRSNRKGSESIEEVQSDIEIAEREKNNAKAKIIEEYEKKMSSEEREDLYDEAVQKILNDGRKREMIGFDRLAKAKYKSIIYDIATNNR